MYNLQAYKRTSLVPRLSLLHTHINFMHMTFHLVSQGGAWYIWAHEGGHRLTLVLLGGHCLTLELWGVMQGHRSVVGAKELVCQEIDRASGARQQVGEWQGSEDKMWATLPPSSKWFCQSGRLPNPNPGLVALRG